MYDLESSCLHLIGLTREHHDVLLYTLSIKVQFRIHKLSLCGNVLIPITSDSLNESG